MGTRYFALIMGIFYTVIGMLGFIPKLLTQPMDAPALVANPGYGYLFGLFPVNLLHDFVHLSIGICGITAYYYFDVAKLFARTLVILYGLLAIMGLIPATNTTFGIIPLFGHDVWLHAGTALLAVYFGFIARPAATDVDTPTAEREMEVSH